MGVDRHQLGMVSIYVFKHQQWNVYLTLPAFSTSRVAQTRQDTSQEDWIHLHHFIVNQDSEPETNHWT